MIRVARRQIVSVFVAAACIVSALLFVVRAQTIPDTLPAELSDHDFWGLVTDFSEPDGFFRSDNLVSNERTYQEPIPELKKHALPNGVYLGVGPDQNFTYITALKPRMSFIVDIRRQNLVQHLLYKAVIEMSTDRVDFLAHLFSRPKPDELDTTAALADMFDAHADVDPSDTMFQKTLADAQKWLTEKHGFALTPEDLHGLERRRPRVLL